MNFLSWLQTHHPEIPEKGASAVLKLAAEGGTVPFIARYRKEQTGNLDEVAIARVIDGHERWEQILKRQKYVIGEIEAQGKLTPELKTQIEAAFDMALLDDLYLPYKQKRKTKAALAREAGLQELADWLWAVGHGEREPEPGQNDQKGLELWAFTFRNEDKGFPDAETALAGAGDILIERLSEDLRLREGVRSAVFSRGCLVTAKAPKAKPHSKFENYFSFHEPIARLLEPQNTHRYLALRRGWIEEELKLDVGAKPGTEDQWEAELLAPFSAAACSRPESIAAAPLLKAAKLALKAHVLPSIENEVHKKLKDGADEIAIRVFADNVRKLLLASPFGAKAVLGVDPGIRTGCKLAIIDASGKYLADTVIHLQSAAEKEKAKAALTEVFKHVPLQAIAVGNGTAGRETEMFLRATVKELGHAIPVVMVSESGASVYSASEVAREEFPDLDITVRGAISIARRLQDPLAELVKVDPKSIGVGQYQHDVSQPALKRSLEQVVESCVNAVGVDLNTASKHLLTHVAGVGPALAEAVVEHREKNGVFGSREEVLKVPRFSSKAFEQAAGFLRVPNSPQPLDRTGVHPERYAAIEEFAKQAGCEVGSLLGAGAQALRGDAGRKLRESVGEFTFNDIVDELEKPGRDPREEFVPFSFRDDIHELKDLQPGMICPGLVTNVTAFGAFVDIGVHQDGLVHVSQLSHKYVKEASEVVSPGDRVQVKVLEINLEKKQIALSMKVGEKPAQARGPRPERGKREPRGDRPPRGNRPPRPERGGGERKYTAKPAAPAAKPLPPRTRPTPPKPAFNNPFGSLAALKSELKPALPTKKSPKP